MRFIYSSRYQADYGPHVFPIEKYRLVADALRRSGIPEAAFVEPNPAPREQLLRVHTERYLDDLENCRRTPRTDSSELPLTKEIIDLFVLSCGGTILAAERALNEGSAVHIGGGFHHAFAEKAEGFCYLNDLAVAIRAMQTQRNITKAMVIDCDLHQGNGTARIFQGDESVFTFSIHQECLYPIKEKSDLDIHLPDGIGDDQYLEHLKRSVPSILDEFRPELILYQAGVDPYERDQLGDLKLTIAGMFERARFVLRCAKQRRIPIAVTLGGGYAHDVRDTVKMHVNTCLATCELSKFASP